MTAPADLTDLTTPMPEMRGFERDEPGDDLQALEDMIRLLEVFAIVPERHEPGALIARLLAE